MAPAWQSEYHVTVKSFLKTGGILDLTAGETTVCKKIVARYRGPVRWRGTWIFNFLIPYAAFGYLIYLRPAVSRWIVPPAAILAEGSSYAVVHH